MTKADEASLNYWYLKSKANEDRCMIWQTIATVSLVFNGMIVGAIVAALIFR